MYTAWDVIEFVFVWLFYVETKGPTLEEIGEIFDGPRTGARIDMQQVQKQIYATENEAEEIKNGRKPQGNFF